MSEDCQPKGKGKVGPVLERWTQFHMEVQLQTFLTWYWMEAGDYLHAPETLRCPSWHQKRPWYPSNERLSGPQNHPECFEEENLWPLSFSLAVPLFSQDPCSSCSSYYVSLVLHIGSTLPAWRTSHWKCPKHIKNGVLCSLCCENLKPHIDDWWLCYMGLTDSSVMLYVLGSDIWANRSLIWRPSLKSRNAEMCRRGSSPSRRWREGAASSHHLY